MKDKILRLTITLSDIKRLDGFCGVFEKKENSYFKAKKAAKMSLPCAKIIH